MSIFQSVDIDERIEDKSKTLFTLCKKTNSAERRRSFILLKKVVIAIVERISFFCSSVLAHFPSVKWFFWQQNGRKGFA